MRPRTSSRLGLLVTVVLSTLVGCSALDLGAYRTLDEWYVGEAYQPEFGLEESNVGAYYVNTVIHTPVWVLHDVSRSALLPVAWAYYAIGSKNDESAGDPVEPDSTVTPADTDPSSGIAPPTEKPEETPEAEAPAPGEEPEKAGTSGESDD